MMTYLRALAGLPGDLWLLIIRNFPGPLGFHLRRRFWRGRLKRLGKNVLIDCGVHFQNPAHISIDDNAWIDLGVIILAGPDGSTRPRRRIANAQFPLERGEVHIGKNVHIAPNCIISGIGGAYVSDDCCFSAGVKAYSLSHHYRSDDSPSDTSIIFGARVADERQYMIEGPIFLDRNVGVALDAVIMPGVSVGANSFVAMKSVVKSSFTNNSLISGNPAKRVRARFEPG